MIVTEESNNESMGINAASILWDKNKVLKFQKKRNSVSSCVILKIDKRV